MEILRSQSLAYLLSKATLGSTLESVCLHHHEEGEAARVSMHL
jgi:hypothetical protein